MTELGWQFWIDRGGTFTDIVARLPDGSCKVHKLLSENPSAYADAALQGMRELMGLSPDEPLPLAQIEAVKMGTTVATNALLERRGEPTVLVITDGFGDALRIGYQNRPDIFALEIKLPEMLYTEVVEVQERYAADGDELVPVDLSKVRSQLQAVYDQGVRSCAIAFLHAYRYPTHEQQVAQIAQAIGFTQISVSHQVSPLIKLISRGDTTVVDAYLSPILRRYIDRVVQTLGRTPLLFMQSNGGLVDAQSFQGKDSLLSGPAGGVVGAVQTCAMAGIERLIGFDMGGTSTDVCHYNGVYERVLETELAGVRLRAPMLAIHTVAAGGGSLVRFDGIRFRVGPASAGSDPGPACYRQGGPLTVTDCNVMVGKIQPAFFPQVFGPAHNLPLDRKQVQAKFAQLTAEIKAATGQKQTSEQVAQGFLRIAIDNMANAIKKISLQRGHDLADYTLCCFGSAGGQHVCQIADVLGMSQILIHPLAGVLSAYGMGLAERRVSRQKTVTLPLTADCRAYLDPVIEQLQRDAIAHLEAQGVDPATIEIQAQAALRYSGTDATLEVDVAAPEQMQAQFDARHQQRYGFTVSDRSLTVETLSVAAVATTHRLAEPEVTATRTAPVQAITTVEMFTCDRTWSTPVYQRADLQPGDQITGPALIMEPTGTNVIEPGWVAQVTPKLHLILQRSSVPPSEVAVNLTRRQPLDVTVSPHPVTLEIFNNLFRAIADQMGITLQNTSYSVNIKERLDFSCALFDQQGHLVANAPHIPVHLGSMGDAVQAVRAQAQRSSEDLQPGDVYVLNDPHHGGTHLPDLTVVTPVFIDPTEPDFYVASRGHHADIGGLTPGSMPPQSRTLTDEGILIAPFLVVRDGQLQVAAFRHLLTNHPYPARNPDHNLADLQAQIAANQCGVRELHKLVDRYGRQTVQAYMGHLQAQAAQAVRQVMTRLRDGTCTYPMDGDRQIQVTITLNPAAQSALIDFTGTSPQQPDNFNAPVAIAKAAVLYVFRTLVADDIPLNEGCLAPLQLQIPQDCMLNPSPNAAVVAGNVETSQAIVNALYGALGVMAASQGTMNNLTFGNEHFQYYETICGGAGAGSTFAGASAVHTHMTNSCLTDPEILEWRFPVQLERFAIRQHSGGHGEHVGGNGVIRRLRFCQPMTVSLLSGQRQYPPCGLCGGEPGEPGENCLEPHQASRTVIPGCTSMQVQAGDIVEIRTPGGGGYGQPQAFT